MVLNNHMSTDPESLSAIEPFKTDVRPEAARAIIDLLAYQAVDKVDVARQAATARIVQNMMANHSEREAQEAAARELTSAGPTTLANAERTRSQAAIRRRRIR
jgi:hypothetical protein